MKNVICFDNNNRTTFYFNFDKQTFVLSDCADLSNKAFLTDNYFCPLWVQDIAISEFQCSLEFAENFGINVRSLELISF